MRFSRYLVPYLIRILRHELRSQHCSCRLYLEPRAPPPRLPLQQRQHLQPTLAPYPKTTAFVLRHYTQCHRPHHLLCHSDQSPPRLAASWCMDLPSIASCVPRHLYWECPQVAVILVVRSRGLVAGVHESSGRVSRSIRAVQHRRARWLCLCKTCRRRLHRLLLRRPLVLLHLGCRRPAWEASRTGAGAERAATWCQIVVRMEGLSECLGCWIVGDRSFDCCCTGYCRRHSAVGRMVVLGMRAVDRWDNSRLVVVVT